MLDLEGYGWMLWDGLQITLMVGISALFVAIAMGMIGAWGKLARNPAVNIVANTYTTVIRGVPELVLLLLVYYGTQTLIQNVASALMGYDVVLDFNPFITGVWTLGFIYGAFATEVFRGAILAVPKGQIEAAYAAGMTRFQMTRRVMLPQVWRYALPGLGNVWMVLIKATALVSMIQLPELTRNAYIGAGNTKLYFSFFFAASLMYLGITVVSVLGQQWMETWARRGMKEA